MNYLEVMISGDSSMDQEVDAGMECASRIIVGIIQAISGEN